MLEQRNDPIAETILREISDKMDALYDEQVCQISVSDTVRRMMERSA